ncbi:MAG: hypothetical protein IJ217_02220 [Clostridia bacterium]|nr:hypothetical protein [Clostridia bacterium]
MDYHYSQKYYIGYSDVDRNNRLKLSKILDLLQNAATGHSHMIGYGAQRMIELGMGWLVLAWKVKILDYPKSDTYVEVRTWSRGTKGIRAYRDLEILDENGKTLILASSHWVLYNLIEKKLMKMLPEMQEGYGALEREALDTPIAKSLEEITEGVKQEIVIGKRDLDTNGHVNNARYADFILEVLPDDFVVNEFEIHYKKQTMYGEKLTVIFDGTTCVMKNEEGETKIIAKINK